MLCVYVLFIYVHSPAFPLVELKNTLYCILYTYPTIQHGYGQKKKPLLVRYKNVRCLILMWVVNTQFVWEFSLFTMHVWDVISMYFPMIFFFISRLCVYKEVHGWFLDFLLLFLSNIFIHVHILIFSCTWFISYLLILNLCLFYLFCQKNPSKSRKVCMPLGSYLYKNDFFTAFKNQFIPPTRQD